MTGGRFFYHVIPAASDSWQRIVKEDERCLRRYKCDGWGHRRIIFAKGFV